MFSTLSQGFLDCKNYFGNTGNYSQPNPQLLLNYYFTGAFTGGDSIGLDLGRSLSSPKRITRIRLSIQFVTALFQRWPMPGAGGSLHETCGSFFKDNE